MTNRTALHLNVLLASEGVNTARVFVKFKSTTREFLVKVPEACSTYFTECSEDALGTAKKEWEWLLAQPQVIAA